MNSGVRGHTFTIYEMFAPIYHAAAQRGIDALVIDECELWQIGAMLGTFGEDDVDARRRDDAEVFRQRIAAHRGEGEAPEVVPLSANVIPFAQRLV